MSYLCQRVYWTCGNRVTYRYNNIITPSSHIIQIQRHLCAMPDNALAPSHFSPLTPPLPTRYSSGSSSRFKWQLSRIAAKP